MEDEWGNEWPDPVHAALTNPYPLGSFGRLTSFRSARAKLKHARTTHDEMMRRSLGMQLAIHESLRIVLDPDGSQYKFFVDELEPLPMDWSVRLGETLYTLRSALDHAAHELAVMARGADLDDTESRKTQFLLTKDPLEWKARHRTCLPGLSEDQFALIERLQPYPERDRHHRPTAFDQAAYWLGLLNDLGNVEKHRHPHLVVHAVGPGSWSNGRPQPEVFTGALEPGRMVAKMAHYPEFQPNVSHQPRFAFQTYLIHTDGPLAFPGVLGLITSMIERVLDVLDPSPWFATRRAQHLAALPPRTE